MLSVQGEPGEEELLALGEVWSRLIEFAQGITSHSLTEITAQLEAAKAEIIAILGDAPAVGSNGSTSSTSDGDGSDTGSTTPAEGDGDTGSTTSAEGDGDTGATTATEPAAPAPEDDTTPDAPAPEEETTEPSTTPEDTPTPEAD